MRKHKFCPDKQKCNNVPVYVVVTEEINYFHKIMT